MSTSTSEGGLVAADTQQNCPSRVRVYHLETGKRLLLPCRRRVCVVCGPRHWRPRVLAGLHSGLKGKATPYLALLLTAPGDVAPWVWNERASGAWHHFTTLLRRHWGPVAAEALEYWRVAELQERGHVHFHVVLRGLEFLPVTNASGTGLRDMAVQAGFGPWVGVRRPRDYPGGVRSVGWYFSKYLLKAYSGVAGVRKIVTFSQGWRVGWIDRVRKATGEWLFVGSAHASWESVGQVVAGPRGAAPRAKPYRAPWWRRSWQAARGAWGETEPLPEWA